MPAVCSSDLDCMRQDVAVQQVMQALLQGGQVAVLEVRYAHKRLTEVPEEQLAQWTVHVGRASPHSHCYLR